MPGWMQDTSQCRTYEDLPENARSYVEKIEELINVPGLYRENNYKHVFVTEVIIYCLFILDIATGSIGKFKYSALQL